MQNCTKSHKIAKNQAMWHKNTKSHNIKQKLCRVAQICINLHKFTQTCAKSCKVKQTHTKLTTRANFKDNLL